MDRQESAKGRMRTLAARRKAVIRSDYAVSELSAKTVKALALKPSEVRSLGWRWPRRWMALPLDR